MLKLDTEIDLGAFWSWWHQELTAALMDYTGGGYSQGWLVVEPGESGLKLSYQTRLSQTVLGEFDNTSEAKARLKALFEQQAQLNNAAILLRIPQHLGMRKILSLPEAVGANLVQVLAYEFDRYTPFKAEQVYYDHVGLSKPLNGQLKLVLLIVQKTVLDNLNEQALALGLKPTYADYALEPLPQLGTKERYNLLPEATRHLRSNKPRLVMFVSLGLCLLLFLATLIMPLWGAYRGIDKLKFHARSVEKAALNIEESKRGIDDVYQATQTLIAKKEQAPLLVDAINRLSKLLKDDTWVSQIRYSNGTLELLGESGNASDLLAILEKTNYFKNARFISPVTQDQATGKERFQLSTEIIPAAHVSKPK